MFLFQSNLILLYRYTIFSNFFEGTKGFCKNALLRSELCLFSLIILVFFFHVICFPHVFDPPWRIHINNEGVCSFLCSVGRFVSSIELSLPGSVWKTCVCKGRGGWRTSFMVSGHRPPWQGSGGPKCQKEEHLLRGQNSQKKWWLVLVYLLSLEEDPGGNVQAACSSARVREQAGLPGTDLMQPSPVLHLLLTPSFLSVLWLQAFSFSRQVGASSVAHSGLRCFYSV